jgi:hypothetical protein
MLHSVQLQTIAAARTQFDKVLVILDAVLLWSSHWFHEPLIKVAVKDG